jgi:hypothetical protein
LVSRAAAGGLERFLRLLLLDHLLLEEAVGGLADG